MPLSHIIFDLDGTLIDSVAVCTHLINDMLAARGGTKRVSCDLVKQHISIGGAKMISALLGQACKDPEQEIKEFRERYAELATPADSLFPGVRDGLSMLIKLGYSLAICSNKPQALCEKVLTDLNISDFFKVIVGGDVVNQAKPSPGHIDYILKRIGGQRRACIMVGDSHIDYTLARNAEIPFILVGYGYGDFIEHPEDALYASTFNDVTHIIKRYGVV